jgi:hypothetical protein
MIDLKIDPEMKAFLETTRKQIEVKCATFGHQWCRVPSSTGLVTLCVRCGERQKERFIRCPHCFGSGEIEVEE